ncbi:MAG TPA: type II/IV secretion system ATPase subunit [Dehalococcoidia bacterium]|nr:type II/IV secretion system ATPase subunit [Dehalococcoidia bacterium]
MGQTLPFRTAEPDSDAHAGGSCVLRSLLPPPLAEEADKAPHLMEYLHKIPVADVGVPEYFEKLDRKMGDMEDPNLIYPVGQGVYIHIFPDHSDVRNYYIPIEPSAEGLDELLEEIEVRLLDYVDELATAETDEDRLRVLHLAIDEICQVVNGKRNGNGAKNGNGAGDAASKFPLFFFKKKGNGRRRGERIPVNQQEYEALRYRIERDKIGVGVLQPLILDPNIEDISCSGLGTVYVEHKVFKGLKSTITFENEAELDDFVLRLSERIKKPVTYKNPIVDATLPDGSRINIVYGGDVSKRGSNFTIRKFATTPMSIVEIAMTGSLSWEMAAYLSLIIEEGMNMFVSGETASGKTTLMNAVTTFIRPDAKIVSIEDTPELQVPHQNWVREVVRGAMSEADSSVSMFSLLKAALRQRPDEIIVGEIRGEEGAIAFQAMQTGHACMATFHASTVEKLIQRLTGHPINVPKTYVDNLNVVVIASAVRLPNGKRGRRILSINEIVGYDPVANSFSFVEVFRWNPLTDEHEFTGYMNSYLLEHRVAPTRGIPKREVRRVYELVERRAALLKKLADQGVTDFYDLFKVLTKAQRQGLF